MLDLCADLLFASKMSRQIFMDIQIGNFFDQTTGGTCCLQTVPA